MKTEAWVLYEGPRAESDDPPCRGTFVREEIDIGELASNEALVRPIFGCWEGNMTHALLRRPVDVCRIRNEKRVVLGNAGVVRVLKTGRDVRTLGEGDVCVVAGNAVVDRHGFMIRALAFDAPGTMGVLAKIARMPAHTLMPIPENTKHSLRRWAALAPRYVTALANWKVAIACLRSQMSERDLPSPFVWGWGGGTALAELELAKMDGCRVAMISSDEHRLQWIAKLGITAIDRREFPTLVFDEERYRTDPTVRRRYQEDEKRFLAQVSRHTDGQGVSIFVDNLGAPLFRATLKALARQGVVTTAGWKLGETLPLNRARECVQHHIHVHTHGFRDHEAQEAMELSERTGWLPLDDGEPIFEWDEVPELARRFEAGEVSSYFPLFRVNPD